MSVITTLKERVHSYEELTDIKLLKRVPTIIIVNGRSFRKITSLLQKPFSPQFLELMSSIMIKLSQEIDGTTFSYSFNDEIVIVARNDQTINTDMWYNGNVQKIVSAAASIATLECMRIAKAREINLFGDPIFIAKTFVVPNVSEAINVLVAKQQQNFHIALHNACFYELAKKYKPEVVAQTLYGKSPQEKSEILYDETNNDFNNYAAPFKKGVACYRAPKIINMGGDEEIKNKLIIDMEIPLFTKEPDFLSNIFKSGRDIFRAKRDV